MTRVPVCFHEPRSRGYEILIGPGLLARAGAEIARRLPGHQPFVISSPRVWRLHGAALQASLRSAGFGPAARHLVPDGEANKTFAQYQRCLEALARFGQGGARRPLALLFGGGVVGDLGGFAAASYKRGIPFVQLPTTLLSMVDSSVGGKLGVDFRTPRGVIKNLVGAFAQPRLVMADPALLTTLPPAELRSGLGEVVKTALLFDPALLTLLERRAPAVLKADPALMARIIRACLRHKALVVMADEFDTRGERALLNLGHTFGHALESAAGLSWRHGEAVAWGLACACDLSARLGLARPGLRRVAPLLERLGFRTRAAGFTPAALLKPMAEDKKFQGDLRFILPIKPGQSRLAVVKDRAAVAAVLAGRLNAKPRGVDHG